MRLVAFGCSHTFGQSLPDTWDYKNKQPVTDQGPSKYAWPQILANKLNIECVNNGVPGASNKEIWYRILEFEFYKHDVVIINWSYFNRWCIIDDESDLKLTQFLLGGKLGIINESVPSEPISIAKPINCKAFFKYVYNYNDIKIDFYLRANHIQTILQSKIKLIKHLRLRSLNEYKIKYPKWNQVKISNINFLNFQGEKILKALDNRHPGPESHEQFAEEIYNEIKNEIT